MFTCFLRTSLLAQAGFLRMFFTRQNFDGVIVVGTGLAGLTTTLQLLEKGIPVTLLEKTAKFGGNSAKASSGINGVPTRFQNKALNDSIENFYKDTIKSGKGLSNIELVKTLTENSVDAINWLTGEQLDIDLSAVTQLGGHSHPRTHRGSGKLPPGFAIISGLSKKLQEFENDPNGKLLVCRDTKLKSLIVENDQVKGIEYESNDSAVHKLFANAVVLATGGFSANYETGDQGGYLSKYRPDLLVLPLTNGQQTTGDGQRIAERDAGASLIHMDQVQVHPTGFVQLKSDESARNKWKFLCGELIRGIGGILISPINGNRFVNELTTRDAVTEAIVVNCPISEQNTYGIDPNQSVAVIAVSGKDYEKAKNHIDFYVFQNLLFKGTVADIVNISKKLQPNHSVKPIDVLKTLMNYSEKCLANETDELGRQYHGSGFENSLEQVVYYGLVTPSIHFTMGGIEITKNGEVLNKSGNIVKGLYAVGEVSGGVHGGCRLGGSSLLECVVFGTAVSNAIANKRA